MDGLNQRISKIIEYSGLTPSEFAEAVDVPRSSISHIASGRNKPSLDFLIKVKDRFPELEWQWLIKGEGEMKTEQPQKRDIPLPPPDLFSIIEDDDFGIAEEKKEKKENPQESAVPEAMPITGKISDSQQLELKRQNNTAQDSISQPSKIKRIVLFFEDGKFESFEP